MLFYPHFSEQAAMVLWLLVFLQVVYFSGIAQRGVLVGPHLRFYRAKMRVCNPPAVAVKMPSACAVERVASPAD